MLLHCQFILRPFLVEGLCANLCLIHIGSFAVWTFCWGQFWLLDQLQEVEKAFNNRRRWIRGWFVVLTADSIMIEWRGRSFELVWGTESEVGDAGTNNDIIMATKQRHGQAHSFPHFKWKDWNIALTKELRITDNTPTSDTRSSTNQSNLQTNVGMMTSHTYVIQKSLVCSLNCNM